MIFLKDVKKKYDHLLPLNIIGCSTIFFSAILIPIWSVPHTMAARNILIAAILIGLIFNGLNWSKYKGQLNIFIVFCVYLVIHLLFFSTNIQFAIKNFRSEWLKFILCFILGLGIALVIIRYQIKKILLWIGVLFSIPLLTHFVQVLFIWGSSSNGFPWGYLGFNSMHGDLAYGGLASIILLSVFLNFEASKKWEYVLTYALLAVCLLSPAIAKSRGGVLFGALAISLITLSSFISPKVTRARQAFMMKLISIPCLLIIMGLAIYSLSAADSVRWNRAIEKLNVGLLSASDALDISCNAGTKSQSIDLSSGDPSLHELKKAEELNLAEGDGARVIGAISGIKLSLENPMGINQSRQAFQIALIQHCGFTPKTMLSHSHNGLINTSLAIGIPGVVILLALYFSCLRIGLSNLPNPIAFALAFWALIWIIRALFDAALQDQVLEIQAFILALLLGLNLQRADLNAARA